MQATLRKLKAVSGGPFSSTVKNYRLLTLTEPGHFSTSEKWGSFCLAHFRNEEKNNILSDNMIAKSGGFGQGKLSCVCLLLNPNLFFLFLWKIRGCYKLSHIIIDFSKHSTDINSGTLVSLRQRKKRLRGLLARVGRTGRQR